MPRLKKTLVTRAIKARKYRQANKSTAIANIPLNTNLPESESSSDVQNPSKTNPVSSKKTYKKFGKFRCLVDNEVDVNKAALDGHSSESSSSNNTHSISCSESEVSHSPQAGIQSNSNLSDSIRRNLNNIIGIEPLPNMHNVYKNSTSIALDANYDTDEMASEEGSDTQTVNDILTVIEIIDDESDDSTALEDNIQVLKIDDSPMYSNVNSPQITEMETVMEDCEQSLDLNYVEHSEEVVFEVHENLSDNYRSNYVYEGHNIDNEISKEDYTDMIYLDQDSEIEVINEQLPYMDLTKIEIAEIIHNAVPRENPIDKMTPVLKSRAEIDSTEIIPMPKPKTDISETMLNSITLPKPRENLTDKTTLIFKSKEEITNTQIVPIPKPKTEISEIMHTAIPLPKPKEILIDKTTPILKSKREIKNTRIKSMPKPKTDISETMLNSITLPKPRENLIDKTTMIFKSKGELKHTQIIPMPIPKTEIMLNAIPLPKPTENLIDKTTMIFKSKGELKQTQIIPMPIPKTEIMLNAIPLPKPTENLIDKTTMIFKSKGELKHTQIIPTPIPKTEIMLNAIPLPKPRENPIDKTTMIFKSKGELKQTQIIPMPIPKTEILEIIHTTVAIPVGENVIDRRAPILQSKEEVEIPKINISEIMHSAIPVRNQTHEIIDKTLITKAKEANQIIPGVLPMSKSKQEIKIIPKTSPEPKQKIEIVDAAKALSKSKRDLKIPKAKHKKTTVNKTTIFKSQEEIEAIPMPQPKEVTGDVKPKTTMVSQSEEYHALAKVSDKSVGMDVSNVCKSISEIKIKTSDLESPLKKSAIESETSSSGVRRSNRIKSSLKPLSKGRGLVKSDKHIKKSTVKSRPHENTDSSSNSPQYLLKTSENKSVSKVTPALGLPSSTDSDLKPVKVKSRWRRSSELELVYNSPCSHPTNTTISEVSVPAVNECTPDKEKNNDATENQLQFDKEMELRLSQFVHLQENDYHCDRMISKEAKKMVCDCFLTPEEVDRGEFGCGEDCLNRLLMIECGSRCVVGERCTNKRFQNNQYANCKVFKTDKKGFGIQAIADMSQNDFIMEYVGEVLNTSQFKKRAKEYSEDKNRHYYFMALKSDAIIDATQKGNVSRFINHSCDPNAETQKWTVNGELRIGFFSKREITLGEEITFDYQFQRYGKEAQRCFCEASNCRGWIGEEPDDEDDYEEEDDDYGEESEMEEIVVQNGEPVKLEPQEEKIEGQAVQKIETVTADGEIKNEVKLEETIQKVKVKKVRKNIVRRNRKKEIFEDVDLDDEISKLHRTGLKNQAHTLTLSRLMVRAKDIRPRIQLLLLIRNGEPACRRLFLDYHGLRLIYGWMNESVEVENCSSVTESKGEADRSRNEKDVFSFRLEILQALANLPIPNKTMLKDSKVLPTVEKWGREMETSKLTNVNSPNSSSESEPSTPLLIDEATGLPLEKQVKPTLEIKKTESLGENINKNYDGKECKLQIAETPIEMAKTESEFDSGISDCTVEPKKNIEIEPHLLKDKLREIIKKLLNSWSSLKEVFRIPKRERIEQMKEHEREANRDYIQREGSSGSRYKTERDRRDKERDSSDRFMWKSDRFRSSDNERKSVDISSLSKLTKYERRHQFAMQVAAEEQEKRDKVKTEMFRAQQELWRVHRNHCLTMGIDPCLAACPDPANGLPMFYNPAKSQWQGHPSVCGMVVGLDGQPLNIPSMLPPPPDVSMQLPPAPDFSVHHNYLPSVKCQTAADVNMLRPILPPTNYPAYSTIPVPPMPYSQIPTHYHQGTPLQHMNPPLPAFQPNFLPPVPSYTPHMNSRIPTVVSNMQQIPPTPPHPPTPPVHPTQPVLPIHQPQAIQPVYQSQPIPSVYNCQPIPTIYQSQPAPLQPILPVQPQPIIPFQTHPILPIQPPLPKQPKPPEAFTDTLGYRGGYETCNVPIPAAMESQVIETDAGDKTAADEDNDLIPYALDLPEGWKWAQDDKFRIYYYHVEKRKPQWLPPEFSKSLIGSFSEYGSDSAVSNSSESSSCESSGASSSDSEMEDTLLMRQVHGNIRQQDKSTKSHHTTSRKYKGRNNVLKAEAESTTLGDNGRISSPILRHKRYDQLLKKRDHKRRLASKRISEVVSTSDLNACENDEDGELTPQPELDGKWGTLVEDSIECDSSQILGESVIWSPVPNKKRRREGLVEEHIISPITDEDRLAYKAELKRYKERKEKSRRRKLHEKQIDKIVKLKPEKLEQVKIDVENQRLPETVQEREVETIITLKSPEQTKRKSKSDDSSKIKTKPAKRPKIKIKIKDKDCQRDVKKDSSKRRKEEELGEFSLEGDLNSKQIQKIKEHFRSSMAKVMVYNLNPYRKPDCKKGRITNTEDFKHLARKLTHFVMVKELKHCKTVEELTCTESVKLKAREFVKKYMAKFGEAYLKPEDEMEY